MITLIAAFLTMFMTLMGNAAPDDVTIVPANVGPHDFVEDGVFSYCLCDECCYVEAVKAFEDEFTALFNSYETKRAKNGAMMIRSGNSGSFKFCKKG